MTTALEVLEARIAAKDAAIEEIERQCNYLENDDPVKSSLLQQAAEQAMENAAQKLGEYMAVVASYKLEERRRKTDEVLEVEPDGTIRFIR